MHFLVSIYNESLRFAPCSVLSVIYWARKCLRQHHFPSPPLLKMLGLLHSALNVLILHSLHFTYSSVPGYGNMHILHCHNSSSQSLSWMKTHLYPVFLGLNIKTAWVWKNLFTWLWWMMTNVSLKGTKVDKLQPKKSNWSQWCRTELEWVCNSVRCDVFTNLK